MGTNICRIIYRTAIWKGSTVNIDDDIHYNLDGQ